MRRGITGGYVATPATVVALSSAYAAVGSGLPAALDSVQTAIAKLAGYATTLSLGSGKTACRATTTANITLSGTQTIDGVTLTTGDRIFVRVQSTASQNGIYIYNSAGAYTRATDMDAWTEVPGVIIPVTEGTLYHDTMWLITADAGGTLGSTSITSQAFSISSYLALDTILVGNASNIAAQVAITSAATASTAMRRDANINTAVNNIATNFTSTATAAGTTTLTAASSRTQEFTGATTQNCKLPDATTLIVNTIFIVRNNSTGAVTVQYNDATSLVVVAAATQVELQCSNIGTTNGTWQITTMPILAAAAGQTGTGPNVRATSPTLVTPTLGVASATSINFGGSALGTYADPSGLTPVLTFDTPGDLSVSYNTQGMSIIKIGKIRHVYFWVDTSAFTHTTASGGLKITGLTEAVSANVGIPVVGSLFCGGITKAGYTQFYPIVFNNTTDILLYANGSGVVGDPVVVANAPTGGRIQLIGQLTYIVD